MTNITMLPQPHRSQFVRHIADVDPLALDRFGGKGAGLARMAAVGIPVPPAFVISTDAFRAYRASGDTLPQGLTQEVDAALLQLEKATGKRFAGQGAPLLVSVRSGAKVSMPGMMDTVLNLGLNARSAFELARLAGDAHFAVDTWIRFWTMFSNIVLHLDPDQLAGQIAKARTAAEKSRSEESFAALEQAIVASIEAQGASASTDPRAQLDQAISAVFESWDSRRAKAYRVHHGIADDLGTAVTIQAMVFGNLNGQSGSGVAFTRNPNTGAAELYGEYLTGRQGEELVSGSTTPVDLANPQLMNADLRCTLVEYGRKLEALYRDALDVEFTVESSKLYLLQVRPAKRTAQAAVRIAVDMVDEGVLTEHEGLRLVSTEQVRRLLRPAFDAAALAAAEELARGVGSSPGHAFGAAILDADRAANLAMAGEHVILLRPSTSPQDIRGMLSADGIVTARGGALSHAAVVSRALDKPCIVGCEAIAIDLEAQRFSVDGRHFPEGTPISIDGTTGKVYTGVLPLQAAARDEGALGTLLSWADRQSQISPWIGVQSETEARDAAALQPAGLGVVALTDLLISAGTVGELIAAINEISQGREGPEIEDKVANVAYDACRRLLLETPGLPIDIRLPNVGSMRAQRMIEAWASLTPRLFLPLGMQAYYRPLLRGIASAARDMNHARVTALIGGITDPAELAKFQTAAAETGCIAVGAVIQNTAALHAAQAMIERDCAVWIDVRELIRTAHGLPHELVFAGGVFDSYAADGYISVNPRTTLIPFLRNMLEQLIRGATSRGSSIPRIDCGAAVLPAVVGELYDIGYRVFSLPKNQYASVRLMLGQRAPEVCHE